MKIFISILFLISALVSKTESPIKESFFKGKWNSNGSHLFHKLELKKDYTYLLEKNFDFGGTASKGNWEVRNDTLFLHQKEFKGDFSNAKFHTEEKNQFMYFVKIDSKTIESICPDKTYSDRKWHRAKKK